MQESTDVTQYAPIAAALHKLDTAGMDTTRRKFNIAYLIAKVKWRHSVSCRRGIVST